MNAEYERWVRALRERGMCCEPAKRSVIVCTRPAGHEGRHGGRFDTTPRSATPFIWRTGEEAQIPPSNEWGTDFVRALIAPMLDEDLRT